MRVCMMTNTYLPHVSGLAHSVHTFAEQLRSAGHPVLVVCPNYPGAEEGEENRVVRIPAIENFNRGSFSLRRPLSRSEVEQIERFSPDLIHSHHPFLMGDTALRLAKRWDIPLVFTQHAFYERLTHYLPFDSEVLRRLAGELLTSYANLCSLLIAPSRQIAHLIAKRGVTTPIKVVPTGIDVELFRRGNRELGRRRWDLPDDAFVAGFVGRLVPEKNLDYLSEALVTAARAVNGLHVLVVGEGPHAKLMQKRFANAGLKERLRLTKSLRGEELANAYNAMDVFTFASLNETQGMVLVEAMASGVPAVALDGPAVREVVQDGKNGRLLPSDSSPGAFAQAVEEAYSSRAQKAEWSKAALEVAAAFSKKRCAERMLSVYESLLASKGRTHTPSDRSVWDQLAGRVEAEWQLMAGRASALSASLFPSDETG